MAGDITINAASVTVNRDLIAGDDIVITTTGAVTNNDVIYADDGTSGGNGLVIDAGGEIVNSAENQFMVKVMLCWFQTHISPMPITVILRLAAI